MREEIINKKMDHMRRALDAAPGFEFRTVSASAEIDMLGNEVSLGFGFNPGIGHAYLQLHRGPTSAWVRRLVPQLRRAGYAELVRFRDEVCYQRWLRGRKQLAAELRRLGALRVEDDLKSWPVRQPAPKPNPKCKSDSDCAEIFELIRKIGRPWTVDFMHYPHVTTKVAPELTGTRLGVLVLAYDEPPAEPRVGAWVDLTAPLAWGKRPSEKRVALLGSLVQGLGFERGQGSHFCFSTRARHRSIEAALWKCERIIERLEASASGSRY